MREAGCAGDAAVLSVLGAATFTETFGHLYQARDLAAYLAEKHSVVAYAEAIAREDTLLLLVEDEAGAAVAYLMCGPVHVPVSQPEPGACELLRLYVSAPAQGGGLGSYLVGRALAWSAARAAPCLYLSVFSENVGAQRLYAGFGFEIVGTYGFKVGTHVDHELIMRRTP